MSHPTTCLGCARYGNGWCAHLDHIALRFNCQSQQYLQSAGDPCIDFAERAVTQGVKPDINAFALMVQALSGHLTPPEPARPGPWRQHRWLGDEAEGAPALDGMPTQAVERDIANQVSVGSISPHKGEVYSKQ